uniref:Uncharacterized protein n=1 Tax=Anguilla anguilla TaxID=7936 RepID=A0A0E9WJN9_ANGAN
MQEYSPRLPKHERIKRNPKGAAVPVEFCGFLSISCQGLENKVCRFLSQST